MGGGTENRMFQSSTAPLPLLAIASNYTRDTRARGFICDRADRQTCKVARELGASSLL
jgi:hypothetical protein